MAQGSSVSYANSYTNISTNTTITIKTGAGILHSIAINTPGASWTVTVSDGANTIAVITPSTGQDSMIYDCAFLSGLSVTTAGTTPGNVTVNWQ